MAIITKKQGKLEYLVAEGITVPHCFTTRYGGVSEGSQSGLNLAIGRGDSPENVKTNLRILATALGYDPEKYVLTRQTHTDIVRVVTDADCNGYFHRDYPECDGLVTNTPGVTLMLELLQQIERTGKKQLRAQRLRCLFSLVGALACVAAVVMLVGVLPQVEAMIAHMQTTLNNLESVTAQLTSMDLEGMIVNVDKLVSVGQETLTETAGMLESLDMETLNRAIRDLAAVVEPLARFFR